MLRRFVKDESGMTMGLVIITVVLIGVMGAGLLTFVSTDLNTVVEVNQGQKALQMAETGVRAAQRQILTDGNPSTNYDGGTDDLPWSYCYSPPPTTNLCTSATPTATGSSGMRLDMGSDYARVTILEVSSSPLTFKVVSEGRVGQARRKVEAQFRFAGAVTTPRAFLTYGKLNLTGGATSRGVSFFALNDVLYSGRFNLGTEPDSYFGKWAEVVGGGSGPYPDATTGSYPNDYNKTPRGSNLPGIGTRGRVIYEPGNNPFMGTRSYDSTTNPAIVSSYGSTYDASKMAFPFRVPTPTEDHESIVALGQRALALERDNPGQSYYIDSIPGNGQNDAGMPNRAAGATPLAVNSWYANSDFATVRFYEYESYDVNNRVKYAESPIPSCTNTTSTPPRGVIVLVNGDLLMEANRQFNGAMMVRAYDRAYDASGATRLPPPSDISSLTNGSYEATGSGCMKGYANSSGNMKVSGEREITAGGVPDLSGLSAFQGSTQMVSWRELYQ